MKNLLSLTLTLLLTLILLSCSSNEIVNLRVAKERVENYYESGKFDKELDDVIKDAEEKFSKIKVTKNLVVIFDVDETALDNYGLAKQMDFGYVYDLNKQWNKELKAPAIKQVQGLYNFLIKRGFKIIFLTGRNTNEYDVTYKNLELAGYSGFDTLMTQRKDEQNLNAQEFKTKKRTELIKQGYEIVGTVGDQWIDLNGPYSGIQIKIPNYLYEIK
jgi:acid phosphatase